MDLAEFLNERLDEDQFIAEGAARTDDGLGGQWIPAAIASTWLVNADARVDDHVARHDPVRVQREVAAKRAILAEHRPYDTSDADELRQRCFVCASSRAYSTGAAIQEPWPCPTLRTLAAIYSDHPDYDPRWKA